MDGNSAPRAMYFSSSSCYAERRLRRLQRKHFRLPSSRQATRWNCEAPGMGAQKGFVVVVVVVVVGGGGGGGGGDVGVRRGGDAKRGVMAGRTFWLGYCIPQASATVTLPIFAKPLKDCDAAFAMGGLKSAPQHNGKCGTLLQQVASKSGWLT